eukprot:5917480-Pleurochrysis_carterae.AAC.1
MNRSRKAALSGASEFMTKSLSLAPAPELTPMRMRFCCESHRMRGRGTSHLSTRARAEQGACTRSETRARAGESLQ